jgi:acyl-CoA reductase-like NAD-dependent aldehyde dehydrogenase
MRYGVNGLIPDSEFGRRVRGARVQQQPGTFVGGEWHTGGDRAAPIVDSSSEEVFASVTLAEAADVEATVQAAAVAGDAWAATDPAERAALLDRIADGLDARRDDLAHTITREVGMTLRLAKPIQVGLPIGTFRSAAELVANRPASESTGNSTVLGEPVGVVACITPWNYPLHQLAAKVAPTLAAGCTIVAKPSELAPLSAIALFEVMDEAGCPPGVANLLVGTGPDVGETLVGHPLVSAVSFTGSNAVGRHLGAMAMRDLKRVTLELGGKSPCVVLDDADLARAVPDTVAKCFLNSGQTCSALTRLVVPRARVREAAQLAAAAAARFTVGDPMDEATKLGPLVSAQQRDCVVGYIRRGIDEGATLVTGGVEAPPGLDRGYYVMPTVFSDVDPGMAIAQEEIFGPVLAIIPHDGDDDAVGIANGTPFGLAAAVWSDDETRADRVARRVRAGQVDINGAAYNPFAPFGGMKQSGIGREFGRWGLDEFLEVKAIQR